MFSDEEKRGITLFIRFWSVLFRKQRQLAASRRTADQSFNRRWSFIKFDEVFLPVIDVQPLADVSRSQD